MSDQLFAYLCVYAVFMHLFYFWMIHKLVNKLMSRNYYEYQQKPHVPEKKVQTEELYPQENIARVF